MRDVLVYHTRLTKKLQESSINLLKTCPMCCNNDFNKNIFSWSNRKKGNKTFFFVIFLCTRISLSKKNPYFDKDCRSETGYI